MEDREGLATSNPCKEYIVGGVQILDTFGPDGQKKKQHVEIMPLYRAYPT